MGRADKVWLGLAIAVVVVLAAGSGFLLYRRSQVAAAEQAYVTEATVTLTPVATAPVVPEPKLVTKPRSPGTPPAKGADAGFITKVKSSDGGFVISFDEGKLEKGTAAKIDAAAEHKMPTNGWFLANQTHSVAKYRLDRKCVIVVANPLGAKGSTKTMSHQAFRDAFPGGDEENPLLQKAPFWIVLKGLRIVRIEQIQM